MNHTVYFTFKIIIEVHNTPIMNKHFGLILTFDIDTNNKQLRTKQLTSEINQKPHKKEKLKNLAPKHYNYKQAYVTLSCLTEPPHCFQRICYPLCN